MAPLYELIRGAIDKTAAQDRGLATDRVT
jgi:hypothetical protein